ncbi:MAG TPA: hypothetical protein VKJ47_09425 [Candidatus Binatia bacterium]|nr:hypothetical protein [Candidatus Binatia bacterium]
MTKTAQTDAAARLVAKERDTHKKYRHVLPGTIRAETEGTHAGKITVEIRCQTRGCKAVRRVATSDLFQVKRCAECAVLAKKAARKATAVSKKAS